MIDQNRLVHENRQVTRRGFGGKQTGFDSTLLLQERTDPA